MTPPWWRPALGALAAPALVLALLFTEQLFLLPLLLLSLVVTVPLAITLAASMMRRGGRPAWLAAAALAGSVAYALAFSGPTFGVLGLFVVLPLAVALALLFAAGRPEAAALALVGLALLAGVMSAPRFGAYALDLEWLAALGAALVAAGALWGAGTMRPDAAPPAPADEAPIAAAPRPARPPAPPATQLAAWLVALGLALVLFATTVPLAAVAALAVGLLVLPALVALRDTPPPAIALGALALLGLVPLGSCSAAGRLAGACADPALGLLWAFALAATAWIGLALSRRPEASR